MRILVLVCALGFLGGVRGLAADEPKPAAEAALKAQQRAEVRIAANRRAMRQRIQSLRSAVTLSDYELIRRFRGRDDALLLALLNREFRAASKLLLSFPQEDLDRLLAGGAIQRKAAELDPRQLFLARLAAGVDDPALADVGAVAFAGVDAGVIDCQWMPDAETVAKAGPPPDHHFVLIPAGPEVGPESRDILRTELRRTPYQGLLPKT